MRALRRYADLRGMTKIHAIWQPHKYSRTMDNLQGFVECFEDADDLVILPIWSAGEVEMPIDLKGAFGGYDLTMADRIKRDGASVQALDRRGGVLKTLQNDLIVAFGAGDITYQIRGLK